VECEAKNTYYRLQPRHGSSPASTFLVNPVTLFKSEMQDILILDSAPANEGPESYYAPRANFIFDTASMDDQDYVQWRKFPELWDWDVDSQILSQGTRAWNPKTQPCRFPFGFYSSETGKIVAAELQLSPSARLNTPTCRLALQSSQISKGLRESDLEVIFTDIIDSMSDYVTLSGSSMTLRRIIAESKPRCTITVNVGFKAVVNQWIFKVAVEEQETDESSLKSDVSGARKET
jgi:hypothetical protein